MAETLTEVFFYGLYMDEKVLRALGVEPRRPRRAVLPGRRVVLGRRATLVPAFGAQAFGMVYAMSDAEIQRLYEDPTLEPYRPQAALAHFEDGAATYVTTFIAPHDAGQGMDPVYAARLRQTLAGLGLPDLP